MNAFGSDSLGTRVKKGLGQRPYKYSAISSCDHGSPLRALHRATYCDNLLWVPEGIPTEPQGQNWGRGCEWGTWMCRFWSPKKMRHSYGLMVHKGLPEWKPKPKQNQVHSHDSWNICPPRDLYRNVHSSIVSMLWFIIVKDWKQPKWPSVDEYVIKMCISIW